MPGDALILLGGRDTEPGFRIGPDVLSALGTPRVDVASAVARGRPRRSTQEHAGLAAAAARAANRTVLVDDQAPTTEIEAPHRPSERLVLVGAVAEHGSAGT